jgi:hypothetical protein
LIGASEKYENFPGGRIDYWSNFDVDNFAWITTDFELKFKNRYEF